MEYEGAIYDLMSRGARREEIFKDDRDRETLKASGLPGGCTWGADPTPRSWFVRRKTSKSENRHLVRTDTLLDGRGWNNCIPIRVNPCDPRSFRKSAFNRGSNGLTGMRCHMNSGRIMNETPPEFHVPP